MKLGSIYILSKSKLNKTQIHHKCNLNKNKLYLRPLYLFMIVMVLL